MDLTPKDVAKSFHVLNMDLVHRHFKDENTPYLVCRGVSIDTFNRYTSKEGIVVGLRFLELRNSSIFILELPSESHEYTIGQFERYFLASSGNSDVIGIRRSVTISQAGEPNKEADGSYGPDGDVAGVGPAPQGIQFSKWITLVLEVGRERHILFRKAGQWALYPGIQYIVLISVSPSGRRMEFYQYSIQQPGPLPHHLVRGVLQYDVDDQRAVNIEFDARRILGILPGGPLPQGVNNPMIVNLRDVMRKVVSLIR